MLKNKKSLLMLLVMAFMISCVPAASAATTYLPWVKSVIDKQPIEVDPLLPIFNDGVYSKDCVYKGPKGTAEVYQGDGGRPCITFRAHDGNDGINIEFPTGFFNDADAANKTYLCFDVQYSDTNYNELMLYLYSGGYWDDNSCFVGYKDGVKVSGGQYSSEPWVGKDGRTWTTMKIPLSIFVNIGSTTNLNWQHVKGVTIAAFNRWALWGADFGMPWMDINNIRFANIGTSGINVELNCYKGSYLSGTSLLDKEFLDNTTKERKFRGGLKYTNELDTARDVTLISSVYKDDVLVSIKAKPINIGAKQSKSVYTDHHTLPANTGGYTTYTMLWDSFNTIKPLASYFTLTTADVPVQ